MRDQIDARILGEHHEQLSTSISNLFEAARVAFCRLHAIQWDAPWRKAAPKC